MSKNINGLLEAMDAEYERASETLALCEKAFEYHRERYLEAMDEFDKARDYVQRLAQYRKHLVRSEADLYGEN